MENIATKSNKNIFYGTIIGYINLFLSIVSGLVFIPWIIRSIGSDSYGLYTLSNSLITLFLFDFGMSTTINTFLSKLRAKNDTEGIKHFLSVTYKLYLIINIALLVIFTTLFFCVDYIYVGLTPDQRSSFKIVFLITAVFNLVSFPASSFNGVLQAYEQFGLLKIIEMLNRLFYIVFSAICLLLNLGLFALVIANCVSGFICILLKFLILKFKIKVKSSFKIRITKVYLKEILMFSLWAAIHALASRFVFNIMPSILGIVSDADNITLFSVGASLEGYVYSFSAIMNGFFLPKLARIKEQYKEEPDKYKKEIEKLAFKIGKLQLMIIGLVVVGFFSIGNQFIDWWMKMDLDFTVTYHGTLLIILTQIVFVPELIFYTQMFMEKKTIRSLAICSLIKAGINVVLSFVLGYFYGALGAFISIFIARLFEVVLQNILYKKHLHANLGKFFKNVFLKPIFAIGFAALVGLFVRMSILKVVSLSNIMKSVLMITMYYFVLFAVALDKNDKEFMLSLVSRKK